MIETALESLKMSPRFRDRIAHIEVLPAREPQFGELGTPLSAGIAHYLNSRHIRLYSHQCQAVEALRAGRNVILCTPTASGKTLGFDLPVFETLESDRQATALFVYPTKALSNDQLKVFKDMERATGIRADAAVYDGDTPVSRRGRIREMSRIIVTNPHELHHVLPWHSKWERFFRNLRYVVFDEAHRYRGVFGSNVAFVIRRLRRIARFYGASPRFVLSTATLANPQEFGEKLVGLPFDVISEDGSPRGGKTFLFYNPFFDGAGTLSPHQETRDLFLYFVKRGLQTLCFTASRRMAELIALWSKEATAAGSALAEQIAAYRAGYLPQGAPRDRGRPQAGPPHGGHLDQRPGGGHRHRLARLRDHLGLPGDGACHVAAGGPLGAPQPRCPGRPCGLSEPARPVLDETPRVLLRQAPRAGHHRSGKPLHPLGAAAVRRGRAAV